MDTTAEQDAVYMDLVRKASTAQRARVVGALSAGVRRMAEAGIREAFPAATDEEVAVRVAMRLYGRDVVQRVLGRVPPDAR
ncbi:MAG: hypothetical protein HY904_18475 [Deltaproteobacteria bacterium]|nr:hypothetical protein [Deltaproteobacteria bacterium]